MSEQHVREAQGILGTAVDGKFGANDLAALKALHARATTASEPAQPTQPTGTKSLALRALEWSIKEAAMWDGKPVSAKRIAEYFTGCRRDDKIIGTWLSSEVLSGKHYSFCAAAVGYAEDMVALPGELLPIHRAGALELMRDAIGGLRPGEKWVDVSSVRSGHAKPPSPGALALYERPSSAPGTGHVERVIFADSSGFRACGANESGGRWVEDAALQPYAKAGLLGFVVPT